MNTKEYVRACKVARIDGYSDSASMRKEDWLKTGRRILRQLAKALNLPKDSYDVRINRGGIAVSGEATLHGEWIYVLLGQTAIGPDHGFMWRFCKGSKDYTGGMNRWAKWETLLDIEAFAAMINKERESGHTN